jgi:hypothetical protein
MTEIERLDPEIAVLEAENVVLLRESNCALHRISAHNHNTLQRKLQLAEFRGEIAEVHRQLQTRSSRPRSTASTPISGASIRKSGRRCSEGSPFGDLRSQPENRNRHHNGRGARTEGHRRAIRG